MRRIFTFAIGIFCIIQTLAIAADPPASITKDYDLRNLLIVVPDFTDAPKFGMQREEANAEVTAPSTQPEKDDAEEHAKSLTSWLTSLSRANEPAITVVRADEKFKVTATSQQHERLERQIAEEMQRHTQVTIETRFMYLGKKTEATLPPEVVDKLDFVRIPGRGSAGMQIDEGAATAIVDSGANDPDTSKLTAPRISLFNGQRGYVLAGTQRSFTSGYTKNLDNNHWEPKVDVFQTGFLMDVRCCVDDPGKIVAVDLKPQLSRLMDLKKEPFKDAPADASLEVQVPTLSTRKLDALVSMPAGSTMLFYIPADSKVSKDDQPVYVLMKATVIRP